MTDLGERNSTFNGGFKSQDVDIKFTEGYQPGNWCPENTVGFELNGKTAVLYNGCSYVTVTTPGVADVEFVVSQPVGSS